MFVLRLLLACWQATCNWGSILVFGAFSGGFDCVLGALGFLLPPCVFCGLPILLWGKVKGWDGDAGDVKFYGRFCH